MQRAPLHEEITIWRDSMLGAAELLRGTFGDFSYAPHAHDLACFAVITRGAIRIRMRGTELVAHAGDVFAADEGDVHAGWPVDAAGWSLRTLYIGTESLAAHFTDISVSRIRGVLDGPLIRDAGLAARLLALHRASERNEPALHREECLLAFGRRLFERHVRPFRAEPEDGRELGAVRRTKDYLDAHLDERVSLSAVAESAGLPPFRLLRAFVRAEGISPHVYQRQSRLRRATQLMREGRPLSDVAATAGFADQAHFTRLFRRAMGVTPARYQRICVEGARGRLTVGA